MMRRALRLAARGAGQVAPNPKVGAVIVRDGRVVGEGWHARYGEAHAEVMALQAAGAQARDATAYVTLEPCDHQGNTPPCSQALIAAGVARVVYGVRDPNPAATGGGARLREAGIAVTTGVLEDDAAELIAPFTFAFANTARPFVTLKLAVSIDGAIVNGSRKRASLTGSAARRVVHAMRAEADAVAVGIDTAIADDPALTVRDAPEPRVAPTRVVFDRSARLPTNSVLVNTAPAIPVVLITNGSAPSAEARLRERGVTVFPARSMHDALGRLRQHGIRHLFVEGGAGIASALMGDGLVDRLITFQAPVILGSGALPAFGALSEEAGRRVQLRVIARRAVGADLMTVYGVTMVAAGR